VIEAAIVEILNDTSEITDIVGNRIHPASDPQATPRPKITFQRISTARPHTNDGPMGFPSANIQLDCWADSYKVARQLADIVRRTLDGTNGTIDGTVIHLCLVTGEQDLPQAPEAGQQKGIQRVSLEIQIRWSESI
jgi:hypothetical protein